MNIKDLFKIFDKFSNSLIDELELVDENFRLSLKKNTAPVQVQRVAETQIERPQVFQSDVQGSQGEPESSNVTPEQQVKEAEGKEALSIVTSPIVGTFYRAPAPDAPPFVTEGSQVKHGKTLAVIEAMKVMNHLEAEFDMEVVSILVKNGEMVEFGTPLFEVRAT